MIAEQNKHDLSESFSGIRGIYGKSINEDFAYKYALSYCRLFLDRNSTLIIGGDSRSSTPSLKKSMITAFRDFGVKKIIDVGVVPVQACEYAILAFKASGGVYITASHNEPEYNGWKFLKEDGAILYKEQISKLIKSVSKDKKPTGKWQTNIKIKLVNKNKEAVDKYIDFVLKKIGKQEVDKIKKSKFKILVDPNGGSSLKVLNKLFNKLGVRAKIINASLGKFSRLVEPNIESLAYLKKQMDDGDFQFGCGLDCDADRVEFVLPSDSNFTKEMGQMISGQYVLALACDTYLINTRNQVVVTNDCTSYLVREIIKKYNATIKEVEVGETNVVKEMEKSNSIIGGEGSNGGVITFPIKCRDGIMTIVLVLRLLARENKPLSSILEEYPKYYSERDKKKCLPEGSVKIKKKLEEYFKNKGYKIKKTGGASGGLKILIGKNSFLWFRASKTERGVFRVIADGDDARTVSDALKEGVFMFDKFNK